MHQKTRQKKVRKREWHKKYKDEVYYLFNGICQKCKRKIDNINDGVCHHTTYKNVDGESIYSFEPEYLKEKGVIIWVCNECHNELHKTTSIDGNTRLIEKCIICKERYDNKTRAILLGINEPVCKTCFKKIKKEMRTHNCEVGSENFNKILKNLYSINQKKLF